MIVLDTNVLSEILRPTPSTHVMKWFTTQPATDLFTTAITRGEMAYGVRMLPAGRRRDALQRVVTAVFDEDFRDRTLPFDAAAADAYADIAASRRTAGKPISQFDAMIAAIARTHNATVATHNTKDFMRCGVGLVDPWATVAT